MLAPQYLRPHRFKHAPSLPLLPPLMRTLPFFPCCNPCTLCTPLTMSPMHPMLPDQTSPPDLEGEGVALSMTAFRFGYFYGGDGESHMCADLRNAAGFVRGRGACVTNFLLPVEVRHHHNGGCLRGRERRRVAQGKRGRGDTQPRPMSYLFSRVWVAYCLCLCFPDLLCTPPVHPPAPLHTPCAAACFQPQVRLPQSRGGPAAHAAHHVRICHLDGLV